MKYYIISGENSGDLYGSHLIDSIRKIDNNSIFYCWGGPYIKSRNVEVIRGLDKLSFMGFYEVFKNIFTVLYNLRLIKKELRLKRPNCIILIDYPGFNLKVAKYANDLRIPVFWFVAPQTWAWKESRVKLLEKYVNRLYVILPFEKKYFSSNNINTEYFGHPLLEIINKSPINPIDRKKIILLCPGSRKQEIKSMLPTMLKVINHFRDYKFIISGAKNIELTFYKKYINNQDVQVIYNKNYELMKSASAAIVTSGTVTLELALHKVPQVVCYKTSLITYIIAKKLVKIKFISLVNLLLNKHVVDELIQNQFTLDNLILSLEKTLNKSNIENTINEYNKLESKLNSRLIFDKISESIFLQLKK